ncbi:MAG: hypothetical protein WC645_01590 [Candidatus Margulisiibacteriota bacterium]
MKKVLIAVLFTLLLASFGLAQQLKSKEILNKTNFASYFREYLGYPYDSNGCLHFSPSDIYLLYKTIPTGTKLVIRPYADRSPGLVDSSLTFFDDLVLNETDVQKYAEIFSADDIFMVVYPSLSRLYIYLGGKPYVKLYVHPGPREEYLMLENVIKGKPLVKDFMLATPTDPGTYYILEKTDRYRSPTYSGITQVPFGAVMQKINGTWKYREKMRLEPVPQFIQDDLQKKEGDRYYSYFDPVYDSRGNTVSIKWVGNDFGKYVITWTKDGRTRYPELGYSAGPLVFEQLMIVSGVADLLTMPGVGDFDLLVNKSRPFSAYKNTYDFVSTGGRQGRLVPEEAAFFRLYHGIPLTAQDRSVLDPRMKKAFEDYHSGALPKKLSARNNTISLYHYLRVYNEVLNKQAIWYKKLKDDWSYWGALREALINDFDNEGIAPEARKKMVEGWINDRLEFGTIK